MKSLLCLFILLSILCCSPKRESATKKDPIDSLIEANMKEAGLIGMGAAVFADKKQVWSKSYGFADSAKQLPYKVTTIQNIASISKTFTGICLMKAVEEGKLSLDEDINKYLPFKVANPHFPNEKITLRSLAGHVSGITDRNPTYGDSYFFGGDSPESFGDSPESLGDFLKNYFSPEGKYYSKDNFIAFKPGTHYKYSNIGAGLAGYITELAFGKKLNEISKEIIFQPLKMNDTGWFLSEVNVANHSQLYYYENDSLKNYQLYGLTTYADGGVRTSVSDLSKYFTCLLNGGELNGVRILKEETLKLMMTPQFNASNKPDNIDPTKDNYGIFWGDDAGIIGHTGGDPGVSTWMHYNIAKQTGIITFYNTEPKGKDGFAKIEKINEELWKLAEKYKAGEVPQ